MAYPETPSHASPRLNWLHKEVDIAALAAFRILMGLLMAAEGWGAIMTGWVRANYVEPEFTFNFIGFEFLQILVGPQAYAVYFLLGLAGIGIALGYRYRWSVGLYTILWAAVYFGQKTSYNNHYYLLLIFCFLLWLVPAHRAFSLDVKQGRAHEALSVPYWSKFVFKATLLIVYTYAAIAKLYPDWLDGTTVGIFLSSRADYPILGPFVDSMWFIYLIAYGGIIFDFLVVPALWWKPTRTAAFAVSIGFHLFNSIVFQIGIFPYMMLICTILYFDQTRMRRLFFPKAHPWQGQPLAYLYPASALRQKWLEGSLAVFFALMLLLPLRPYLYPGNPHWNEEGHRLAWHMMLRSKGGYVHFNVINDQGEPIATVRPEQELSAKMARSMATRPDMIWQYAQRIAARYREQEYPDVQVFAVSRVSLNGRKPQPLIDPGANLAAARWSHIKPSPWIAPHPEL